MTATPQTTRSKARSAKRGLVTGSAAKGPDLAANQLKRKIAPAHLNYVRIYKYEPLERVRHIKSGLSATDAKQIISDLDMHFASASRALNVPVSTINRKAKNHEVLAQDESERFLGLARLIGQVQTMVEDSGNSDGFDAAAWTARWLREPLPALGGARPVDLIDTMEGQTLVADAIGRMQSGAYA